MAKFLYTFEMINGIVNLVFYAKQKLFGKSSEELLEEQIEKTVEKVIDSIVESKTETQEETQKETQEQQKETQELSEKQQELSEKQQEFINREIRLTTSKKNKLLKELIFYLNTKKLKLKKEI
jgi:hypothetical protein